MDPINEFKKEKAENINKLGNNPELKKFQQSSS